MSRQTTIYIPDDLRLEIERRIDELIKEFGITHLSMNGYILKLINEDIKNN